MEDQARQTEEAGNRGEKGLEEEIMTAIRSLKNGKAPGQNSFNAEPSKAEPEVAAQVLQTLFAAIWEEKQLSDDWT